MARPGRWTGSPRPAGREHPPPPLPERPDAIRMTLTVKPANGPDRTLDLPSDLAFAGEAWSWVGEALPLVTADSSLEPHKLAGLLRHAFFSASDDAEADSRETQAVRFDEEALHIATRLLCSEDSALEISIAETVRRELFWLVPQNRRVDISINRPDVRVTLDDPAENRNLSLPAAATRLRRPAFHSFPAKIAPRRPEPRPAVSGRRAAGARERPLPATTLIPTTRRPCMESANPMEELIGRERTARLAGLSLLDLDSMTARELRRQGLTAAQARRVKAAFEMGRQLLEAEARLHDKRSHPSALPEEAYRYMRPRYVNEYREHFDVLMMDNRNRLIGHHRVSTGSLTSATVHPREAFRPVIRESAASVIFTHAHPNVAYRTMLR